MKYICPLLVVNDLKKSRYFYETLLEQEVQADLGENLTFKGAFALHLESHYKQLVNVEINHKSNDNELYFECENIFSKFEQLKDEGLTFVHEIMIQPWQQKVFRVYDYDHHIIEIGESLETTALRLYKDGYTIEKIVETLYLSNEKVENIINNWQK